MRIGSLVYSTDQGLGHLAKNFFDAGIVTDVAIVAHGKREEHPEWYPSNSLRLNSLGSSQSQRVKRFVESMDCMLFFETPFMWDLLPYCRKMGIPTVLMPMYECLPAPSDLPYQPDRFLCPSKLDFEIYKDVTDPERAKYLPIPLAENEFLVPYRERKIANVFVHNAGWGGLNGRNGTEEFYTALAYLKKPTKIILRSQKQIRGIPKSTNIRIGNAEIDVRIGTQPKETLWDEGDVFVFPERFNGLSLPLQEARASGMLVLTTYRSPNLGWLPEDVLISPDRIIRSRVSPRCIEFNDAVPSTQNIAKMMDYWNEQDISSFSRSAEEWRNQNSWSVLRPRYIEWFKDVVEKCSRKRA